MPHDDKHSADSALTVTHPRRGASEWKELPKLTTAVRR